MRHLLDKVAWWRPRRPAVAVGWVITDPKASLIWEDPQPLRRKGEQPASAKSVQLCPAALDFEGRHFVVPCPINVRLRVRLEPGKPPMLENADGGQSSIRNKALSQMVTVINPAEWRHPARPILQFKTPYVFLADDPVYLNQLPPYLGFTEPAWPGLQIAGRFPIHVWPRHLMWAFEWFDTTKDLVLVRGQPWFYVRFETSNPASQVRLVEAELTPDVQRYIDSITGVTNYVNRTYSLFERAAKRRPKTLLVRRTR